MNPFLGGIFSKVSRLSGGTDVSSQATLVPSRGEHHVRLQSWDPFFKAGPQAEDRVLDPEAGRPDDTAFFQEKLLCDSCRRLELWVATAYDVNKLRSRRAFIRLGDLGTMRDMRHRAKVAKCVLCQLFVTVAPIMDDNVCREDDEYELRAYSLIDLSVHLSQLRDKTAFDEWLRAADHIALAVAPIAGEVNTWDCQYLRWHYWETGYLICQRVTDACRPAVPPVQAVTPMIEPSVVKEWLDICKSEHGESCSSCSVTPGSRDTSGGAVGHRRPFKLWLIDCRTLAVVPAPAADAPYVALSYVSGPPSPTKPETRRKYDPSKLAFPLPALFSDTIKLTLALGYRYLWIDRYCVEEQEGLDRRRQIQAMDIVFSGADLTILAVESQSAETSRLPGMGPKTPSQRGANSGANLRARHYQPSIRVGDYELTSTMRHPHASVRKSQWSCRAWTLQEALLTRRRLVVTSDQMYFECGAMACTESQRARDLSLHRYMRSRLGTNHQFHSLFSPSAMLSSPEDCSPSASIGDPKSSHFLDGPLNVSNPSNFFGQFTNLVSLFTSRKLTFPSDSLEAFSGIISRFTTAPGSPHRHAQGIPYPACSLLPDSYPDEAVEFFVGALCWRHSQDGIPHHGGWLLVPPPHPRRHQLPSWTWAGWEGRASFPDGLAEWSTPDAAQSLVDQLVIENADGSGLRLDSIGGDKDVEATTPVPALTPPGPSFRFLPCGGEAGKVPVAITFKGLVVDPSLISLPASSSSYSPFTAFTAKFATTRPTALMLGGLRFSFEVSESPDAAAAPSVLLANLRRRKWECVLLARVRDTLHVLLVEPRGSSDVRVGMAVREIVGRDEVDAVRKTGLDFFGERGIRGTMRRIRLV